MLIFLTAVLQVQLRIRFGFDKQDIPTAAVKSQAKALLAAYLDSGLVFLCGINRNCFLSLLLGKYFHSISFCTRGDTNDAKPKEVVK
jgi:hypothetical protein